MLVGASSHMCALSGFCVAVQALVMAPALVQRVWVPGSGSDFYKVHTSKRDGRQRLHTLWNWAGKNIAGRCKLGEMVSRV